MFDKRIDNRFAWDFPCRAINLPSYHEISESELERVVNVTLCLLENKNG